MSSATCAVLAQIFPVLLLVPLIEVRILAPKVRRNKWTKRLVSGGIVFSFLGMLLCVAGVQIGGYEAILAVIAWVLAGLSVGCFFLVAALITGTLELEAESD